MTKKECSDLSQHILMATREGVAQAIETHRRMGRSIVVMRDGQIVEVKPCDIPPRPLPSDES